MYFFLLHPPSIFDTTDNIWPRRLLLKKPITLRHFNKSTHTRTDETATNPHLLFPPLESSNPISHQGHFSHSLSSPLRTHQCVFSGAIRVYYCNPQNQVTQNREENRRRKPKAKMERRNWEVISQIWLFILLDLGEFRAESSFSAMAAPFFSTPFQPYVYQVPRSSRFS